MRKPANVELGAVQKRVNLVQKNIQAYPDPGGHPRHPGAAAAPR